MESTKVARKIRRIFAEVLPETEIRTDVLEEVLIKLGASEEDVEAVLQRFNGTVRVDDFLNFVLPDAEQARSKVAKYDLKNMPGLLAYCRDADVRLVRADYLRELLKSGRTPPRRQEAEHETTRDGRSALLTQEELESKASSGRWQDFTVFALSHVWECREHPDPAAYQLQVLVDALDDFPQILQDLAPINKLSEKWEAAVFIDYVSLYQFGARTEDQDAAFGRAMDHMHVLYSHDETFTLRVETLTPSLHDEVPGPALEERQVRAWSSPANGVVDTALHQLRRTDKDGRCGDSCDWPPKEKNQCLCCPHLHRNSTPYSSRGWCIAEKQWSLSRADAYKTICIPYKKGLAGTAPMTPEEFQEFVEGGSLRFTHRSDLEPVVWLQEWVFRCKTSLAEALTLRFLNAAEVERLCRSLHYYGQLRRLEVSSSEVTGEMAQDMASALQGRKLEELKLNVNGMQDAGAKVLAAALQHSAALQLLWLHENAIGAQGMEALAGALQRHTAMRVLSLGINGFGDAGAKALASAVQHMTALQDLCLQQNSIGDAGAEALGAALQHGTALHALSLWENSIGAKGMEALAGALQRHMAMRELDISTNGFGDAGAKALASAVQHMTALQELWLQQNAIGDAGAEALGAALQHGTALHALYLWENSIGAKGLEALAGALQRHTAMRELVLSSNRFGDAGAKALASAVQHMPALQDLRLQQNAIGDAGAEALAAALRHGAALQILYLHQNAIGDKGDQALSTALVRHVGLRELGLHGNVIGDAGAKALLPTLRQLSALQAFTFYENRISEALRQEVREAVQDHPQLTRLLL